MLIKKESMQLAKINSLPQEIFFPITRTCDSQSKKQRLTWKIEKKT
jgi:hypothetical protein